MPYQIKEIFYTLQGEGYHAGRPAVFCRFAGCNLWSGREEDRARAQCQFCDTDFVGTNGTFGGSYKTAEDLAKTIAAHWPESYTENFDPWRFVVLTGGEPLLQVDTALVDALHAQDFYIALETNGTLLPPLDIDWMCVSPKLAPGAVGKGGEQWQLKMGNELKLVWPQVGFDLQALEQLFFQHFYLQPMDGPVQAENVKRCVEQCLQRPTWKLSLQTHKITGIR